MSRSGYSDDIEDNWRHIMWRGAVTQGIRGKRGQTLLKDMLVAFDALPAKRLISDELKTPDGEVCALGAVGEKRGIDMRKLDPHDYESVAKTFDISEALAREIVFMNDDSFWHDEVPEQRYERMRKWVETQISPVKE